VALDDETLKKVKSRMKAASYVGTSGKSLETVFSRFDSDRSGELEPEEVRKAIRVSMKIPDSQVSDAEIRALCGMLDADRSGTVSISELVAFVGEEPAVSQRTGKSLDGSQSESAGSIQQSPAAASAAPESPRASLQGSRSPRTLSRQITYGVALDDETLKKVKSRMKAASYVGTSGKSLETVFSRFDSDRSGELEPEEVRKAIRVSMKIPDSQVSDAEIRALCGMLDADRSGTVSISELVAFLGEEPAVSQRTGKSFGSYSESGGSSQRDFPGFGSPHQTNAASHAEHHLPSFGDEM